MATKRVKNRAAEVELVPGAWPRFERFIRDIAKAGPQHRSAKPRRRSEAKSTQHGNKIVYELDMAPGRPTKIAKRYIRHSDGSITNLDTAASK